MGFKKGLLFMVAVVNECKFCEISEFHIWLLFLLFTPFTCLLFIYGSSKKIKDRRKEKNILLNSDFISEVEIVTSPSKYIIESFSVSYKFVICLDRCIFEFICVLFFISFFNPFKIQYYLKFLDLHLYFISLNFSRYVHLVLYVVVAEQVTQ